MVKPRYALLVTCLFIGCGGSAVGSVGLTMAAATPGSTTVAQPMMRLHNLMPAPAAAPPSFADRPYIVADDNFSGQPAHKRIWFYNGNRWIDETADAVPNQQTVYGGDDYVSSRQLRVNADGSVQLFFTRKLGNVETMFVANRGAADNATWASTPITGPPASPRQSFMPINAVRLALCPMG